MDVKDNAPTLEGLARRMEALTERLGGLEHENERMRSENASLRSKVSALRGSDEYGVTEESAAFDGWMSRRALLGKAGAAAVAAMAAGTLVSPREAKADTAFFDTVQAAEVQVHTRGVKSFGVIGVQGRSETTGQAGMYAAHLTQGPGVVADGKGPDYAGVLGRNSDGTGIWGQSSKTGYSGVYGQHTGEGYGVVADGAGSAFAGLLGRNPTGHGVRGEGRFGVVGKSSTSSFSGVYGQHTGLGNGVVGEAVGSPHAGVLGRNPNGYGGTFQGGQSQLRLVPASKVGKPTTGSHAKGELYMDKAAALFVCIAGGAPGTWRKVATTA